MAEIHKYLRAIGREVKRGRPRLTVEEETKDCLTRLYGIEGRSIREVAAELGMAEANVRRRLHAAGIPMRSCARRSRLRTIPLEDLKAAVRDKGLSGAARDLGVNRGTLRHHLRVRNRKITLHKQG